VYTVYPCINICTTQIRRLVVETVVEQRVMQVEEKRDLSLL
jgi:hypothetical protein